MNYRRFSKVSGLLLLGLLLTVLQIYPSTTTGNGKWNTATGELPTSVKYGSNIPVALKVTGGNSGWICNVKASLMFKVGLVTWTAFTEKGEYTISGGGPGVCNLRQFVIVSNNYFTKLLTSGGGSWWWSVSVKMIAPTFTKADTFKTNPISFRCYK